MTDTTLSVSWKDHTSELATGYQSLLENNFLVDCTISAEGQSLKAHRLVLSACSPYFQMLFHEETGKHPFVILLDASFETLKAVIDFVYRGETQISEGNLKAFLALAQSLQIKGLNAFSKNYKSKKLTCNTSKNDFQDPSDGKQDTCEVESVCASPKENPKHFSQHHLHCSKDVEYSMSSVPFQGYRAPFGEERSPQEHPKPLGCSEDPVDPEIIVKCESVFEEFSEARNEILDNINSNEPMSRTFASEIDGETSSVFGEQHLNQFPRCNEPSNENMESSVMRHSQQQIMKLSRQETSVRDVTERNDPLLPVILVPKTEHLEAIGREEPMDDTYETEEEREPGNSDLCSKTSGNNKHVCGHGPQSVSGKGLYFHRIPQKFSKDTVTSNWLSFLHLPPISEWPNDYWKRITLCSQHFEESDYNRRHQEQFLVRLMVGAVPSKNPPRGPGAFGELCSSTQYESTHSGDLMVEDAEGHMDTFEEESPGTNSSQVQSSLSTPDTPLRGALSKFKLGYKKYPLKRVMGYRKGQIISPRSYNKFRVAKYFKDKYLRQARRCLDMSSSLTRNVSHEDSQVVDLPKEIFESHKQNSTIPVNCRRYSDRMKALCLAIQGSSAKAYRLLRHVFTLPSSRTLTRIRQSVPLTTGISKTVLNCMVKQLSTMSEIDKLCVLMFDEMSLQKHLDYDPIQDHILGYQDLGGSRHPSFADHSLVFMVRGLISEWKQPVAFHLGPTIREGNLENAIKETVVALQGIGCKVVAMVSDMARSNVSALEKLATKTVPERDDPLIKIGNDKIFVFADPPHLLKILRNNFLKFDIQFRGWDDNKIKFAKFDVLKEFLEYEKKQKMSEVYPLKISDRHLAPNSKEKMRVKLAVQLFSHKVSRELSYFAQKTGNKLAEDLAKFIFIVDKLFDTFNASSVNDKELRTPVTQNSKHHIIWNTLRRSLKDWKFVVRSPSQKKPLSKCFQFWQSNIIAIQSLWKEMRELGVIGIKTRNINQDPLENFFGSVRQQGGCNTDPTSRLFVDIFKILMLNSFAINIPIQKSNVLHTNIALLTDLLNSKSASSELAHSLETLLGEGHSSTSLASLCSVSEDVEVCTNWVNQLCNETTEGMFGSAQNLLLSFLRKRSHYHFPSSCFQCFKSIYHCTHSEPSFNNPTCGECTTLNSTLASEMFKIFISTLQQLQKIGYKPHLSEELKVCAKAIPLQGLSCSIHKDDLFEAILNFIIDFAIQKFCFKVNNCIRDAARKKKPNK